jgi:hypothetical protein
VVQFLLIKFEKERISMGKVGRQVVEQAGFRMNAIGFDGEGLKEIIEDARIEDRNHFEALTPRIYELGGARDIRGYDGSCPPISLSESQLQASALGPPR